MSPDDPRHGTEAGHEQHLRDRERSCSRCHEADLLAERRRGKRRNLGYRYTAEAEPAFDRVERWRQGGASWDDIALHVQLSPSLVHRIYRGGRTQRIYARTFLAVMQAPRHFPLTSLGAVRRIRALQRLGWSCTLIAARAGLDLSTILDGRHGRVFVERQTRIKLAALYEDLQMQLAPTSDRYEKASATRARGYAEKRGWSPPLAWDEIDDAAEKPATGARRQRMHKPHHDVDPVVVQRFLDGDWAVPTTQAERAVIAAAWVERGQSLAALARRTGWKPERYLVLSEQEVA